MKKPNLIITVSGESIALCNRCFAIICYVVCDEKNESCKVLTPNKTYTDAKKDDNAPSYCKQCKELLTYTLQ